jgi:hypothetical protein
VVGTVAYELEDLFAIACGSRSAVDQSPSLLAVLGGNRCRGLAQVFSFMQTRAITAECARWIDCTPAFSRPRILVYPE